MTGSYVTTQRRSGTHAPYYCNDCCRSFKSVDNLDAHLRSSTHNPPNHECSWCDKQFGTLSALVFHWEAGSCPVRYLNKHSVDEAMLLENGKPGSHSTITTIITEHYLQSRGNERHLPAPPTLATPKTLRDRSPSDIRLGYLYKCSQCWKKFKTLRDIEAHLSSPIHHEKVYQCPLSLEGCGKQFATLSGLLQHLEGVARCDLVRNQEASRVLLIYRIFKHLSKGLD